MEHPDRFRYHGRHATSWQPQSAGAASPTRPRAAKEGPDAVGSGGAAGLPQELGAPLASPLRAGGAQGAGAQADSRPPVQALQRSEAAPGAAVGEGALGLWLWDRPLDTAPHCRPDRPPVPRPLSPRPCLAALSPTWVEVPEAGAPGAATERSRHRLLAAGRLAAYKKRLNGWAPTSSSSTRAGSRLLPRSSGPGHPKARRRTSTICSSATSSPPSAPSPSSPPPPPP